MSNIVTRISYSQRDDRWIRHLEYWPWYSRLVMWATKRLPEPVEWWGWNFAMNHTTYLGRETITEDAAYREAPDFVLVVAQRREGNDE